MLVEDILMQQIQANVELAEKKCCRNNTSIIEIWKQFITMEIINLILHYTNLKINAFLDTLDQESHIMLARIKQWNF